MKDRGHVSQSFHELQQRRECEANRCLRWLSPSREQIGKITIREDHVQVVKRRITELPPGKIARATSAVWSGTV